MSKPGFNFVGFPDDLGVKNVNGRLGAREGPQSFWEAFQRIQGQNLVHSKLREMNVVTMSDDLEDNYAAATKVVSDLKKRYPKDRLIVVGGGHDYAYPWLRAVSESGKKLGCLNIDAHFDLRDHQPVMTSGSPFRRLINERLLDGTRLVEFGVQSHCNSPELWKVANKLGVKTHPFESLRNGKAVKVFKSSLRALSKRCDEVLVSVDLDALSYAFAPGVSAPQAEGLTSSELFQMLEIAASDKKVTSVGVFELAPPLDFQNYTSRLAAQAVWHYLDAAFF